MRLPKVPMRASQWPACPETPRKRERPREKALLRRRTHATISSCGSQIRRVGTSAHRACFPAQILVISHSTPPYWRGSLAHCHPGAKPEGSPSKAAACLR